MITYEVAAFDVGVVEVKAEKFLIIESSSHLVFYNVVKHAAANGVPAWNEQVWVAAFSSWISVTSKP